MFTISAFDIDEIIGSNPEYADLDNPMGHIIGRHSYLRAEDELGRRFIGRFLGDGNAELYAGVAEEIQNTLIYGWTPDATWFEDRPVYGSPAYETHMPIEVAEEIHEAEYCPF